MFLLGFSLTGVEISGTEASRGVNARKSGVSLLIVDVEEQLLDSVCSGADSCVRAGAIRVSREDEEMGSREIGFF